MTELPSELKRLRSLSGKTQQEVASPLGFGKSSVANWEAGRTTPTLDTIRELDNLYDARGSLVTLWIDYTSANGLPAWLRSDSELLKRAVSVEIVTPVLVPGILQCESYARFAIAEGRPNDPLNIIDDLVRVRLSLLRDALRVSAIFPESALACAPDSVRADQAGHLLKLSQEGRARVHLVPGVLVGVTSPFQVYRLRDEKEVATSDHVRGTVVFSEPSDLTRFRDLARAARGYARPLSESLRVLKEAAEDAW
ncbi:helix-turn-helix transcriptional regulator [Nocardiopsis metallicus]